MDFSDHATRQDQIYYTDFPTEPIGGKNPYHCCSYCKRSVPEINGDLKKHEKWCQYRINKQNNIRIEGDHFGL